MLVVDDVLATGGALAAAARLVARCSAEVGHAVILELAGLGGRDRLQSGEVFATAAER